MPPLVLSCSNSLFSSKESLEIQNIAMKHFALLLPSNPFQNTNQPRVRSKVYFITLIKTKIAMFRLSRFTNCTATWFLYKLAPKLFSFFGDVFNLNSCKSSVMTSPSDYKGGFNHFQHLAPDWAKHFKYLGAQTPH